MIQINFSLGLEKRWRKRREKGWRRRERGVDDWCLLLRSIITTFYIDTEIYLNYFIFFFFFFFFLNLIFKKGERKEPR